MCKAEIIYKIIYLLVIFKLISCFPDLDDPLRRGKKRKPGSRSTTKRHTNHKPELRNTHFSGRSVLLSGGFDLNDEEVGKFKLWPDGVIPYYIDSVSFPDKMLQNYITNFLENVNQQTRLSFTKLSAPPSEGRWVIFMNRRGHQECHPHSNDDFTTEGVQAVFLGYECMMTGSDLPEAVLAIAGVPPQHNAPNRDDYISIHEENILPNRKHLFQKIGNKDWLFHDLGYDFNSAGHYHSHRYSSNGRATIEAKASNITISENSKLSHNDILKLNMLYNYIVSKFDTIKTHCQTLYKQNPGHDKNIIQVLTNVECFGKKINIGPLKKPLLYTGEVLTKNDKEQEGNLTNRTGDGGLLALNLFEDDDENDPFKGILLKNKKKRKKENRKRDIIDRMVLDLTGITDHSGSF